MLFTSTVFLFLFLPLLIAVHFLARGVAQRNAVLLAASLFFYAWGEPVFVLLLLASIALNHLFGRLIADRSDRGSGAILALGVAAGLIRHYHGVQRLTPAQLASWKRAIEHQRDQAERCGAHYLFLVAPDKGTIYPEHLPDRLSFRTPTALDQLQRELSETSVAHVDLRPPLRSAKRIGKVYWRTGSHWNDLGAKVVDDEIVRALGPWFAALAPRPLEAHRVTWSEGEGRGIASMLHLEDRYRESGPELAAPRPAAAAQVDSVAMLQSLANEAALRESFERAPWQVFETGNAALPRAVIVTDSFGAALRPYLSEHFERSVFLTRILPHAQRLALIELERPDVVIEEIVERNVRGSGGALGDAEFGRTATGSDNQAVPCGRRRVGQPPSAVRPQARGSAATSTISRGQHVRRVAQ